MTTIKVGTRVICNGYPGTVIELCDFAEMVIVRLASGSVCVSLTELTINTRDDYS